MSIYSHAPENYDCPFCRIASGVFMGHTQHDDVIYHDKVVIAFVASHWWQNNPGHALVVPNRHIENIYDLVPEIAVYVQECARQVALAFKQIYGCDGTSTRQHNEPAGNQDIWHYHLHVFPRYDGDQLYELSHTKWLTTLAERRPYAEKLKRYFDGKRLQIAL